MEENKKELPKAYEPNLYEDEIYKKWEESGFFNPDNLDLPENAPAYTIVLPPPNITDKLHLGHSSMLAIEDLLIRYHRMKGYRALWVPGTDHAAIATQNVVEKKLLKEEGKTRHDLGREDFLKEVWNFLDITQHTILHQTRKMGASLDWSRQAFTLDEQRGKAVKKMFIDMYNEGVIYRGERIVNWCPRCKSTLADDEIEYKEQKAKLYIFKYSEDFPFAIATTRPETKLGDTAVAVNPKDERYKDYIGKTFEVDFVGVPLKLKIIADRQVEMDFGTGTLGVTPAHSMVDWKMAETNDLPIIKVINEDGNIREGFGDYSNKTALEAREMIVEKLKEQGLLEKEEEMDNNLSLCYRCDTPIEPLPSKQWFVDVDKKLDRLGGKSLKEKAIEVAKTGEIKFIPERFTKRYIDWMENLHDWCISRQIWFGHRIPVYYKGDEIRVGDQPSEEGWTQDPDTLDTWFSSGMWTISTLGWPDNFQDGKKINDLAKFHPTQVLETGYEIITLWVSRMIIMSFFALGEIPFENVYLHGMVLDKNGKKMSKSKGNGIDPIDVINQFGTDAVRLSLLIGNTPGNDMRLGEDKIEGMRNFVNKLWNVSRYILFSVDMNKIDDNISAKTLADKWILENLENMIYVYHNAIKNYDFSFAMESPDYGLKDFIWNKFADWYLEIYKFQEKNDSLLYYILNTILKLCHPYIPFVTEQIWKEMGKEKLLMIEKIPEETDNMNHTEEVSMDFPMIQNVIVAIRNARNENRIEPAQKIKAIIYSGDNFDLIKNEIIIIKSLRTGISELEIKENGEKIENAIYISLANGIEIYLLAEIDTAKEKARLEKEIANLEKLVSNQEIKLGNSEFIDRAPKAIVDKEKEKLEQWKGELENLRERSTSLK